MRIAFYAPMKPPDHPVPSGDREMARHLWATLEKAGYRPVLASRFVSYEPSGDVAAQERLAEAGRATAAALVRQFRARPAVDRPRLWFTYHLYHKAPDWLGPQVAAALAIPYVVAEASHAGKQANGRWATGYRAAAAAIAAADLLFSPNPDDDEGIRPLLAEAGRLVPIRPGIDATPFVVARTNAADHRRHLAATHAIDPGLPWLATAAMMRPGAKLASYGVLADALARLADRPWRLLVAGDGPASEAVRAAFAPVRERIAWLGQVSETAKAPLLAAADLYVWPAIDEAYGVALIEAQAAGLPVVAGARPGVANVVTDGQTGLLAPTGDAAAFAAAVARLLDDPAERGRLAAQAAAHALRHHHLEAAAVVFRQHLTPLVQHGRRAGRRPACPAA